MSDMTRFSVWIENDLLDRFLRIAQQRGWGNRSEALRHLIRDALVREEWEADAEIIGTITLVYDHHKRDMVAKLTSIQHDHHHAVLSTTHIHIDHTNCLEMIAVRGTASEVQRIVDALIGIRGVKHGKFAVIIIGQRMR